jgi:hypothetical protein
MPIPWLRLIDIALGVTDLARSRKIREQSEQIEQQQQQQQGIETSRGGSVPAGLEARLAGVVVAALKEAFERDTRRLEIERANLEAERERAERVLRLELRRQAADREIGRLRLLAGAAAATWLGTTLMAAVLLRRLNGAAVIDVGPRVAIGGGWLLLLLAFATAFMAQSQVADALARDDSRLDAGPVGGLALWFIVAGLALVGLAVLLS